jgi:hypothetical protein
MSTGGSYERSGEGACGSTRFYFGYDHLTPKVQTERPLRRKERKFAHIMVNELVGQI